MNFNIQRFAAEFGLFSYEDKGKLGAVIGSAVQSDTTVSFFMGNDTDTTPVCTIVTPDDFYYKPVKFDMNLGLVVGNPYVEIAGAKTTITTTVPADSLVNDGITINEAISQARVTLKTGVYDSLVAKESESIPGKLGISHSVNSIYSESFLSKEPTVITITGGAAGDQYALSRQSSLSCVHYNLVGSPTALVHEHNSNYAVLNPHYNEELTAAKMNFDTGVFDYGSWANTWLIKNLRPCMLKYDGTVDYYLDPNDYTKKLDGSPSDVSNVNYQGNAMVEIPRLMVSGGKFGAYASNYGVHHAFYAPYYNESKNKTYYSGGYVKYLYHSLFEASLINGKLRSLKGQTPATVTYSTLLNYAAANGNGWTMSGIQDRKLLLGIAQFICMHLNLYSKIGAGFYDYNTKIAAKTGTLYNKGAFWGSPYDENGGTAVKICHVENLWGGNGNFSKYLYSANNKWYSFNPDTSGAVNGQVLNYADIDSTNTMAASLSGAGNTASTQRYVYRNCLIIGETALGAYNLNTSPNYGKVDGLDADNLGDFVGTSGSTAYAIVGQGRPLSVYATNSEAYGNCHIVYKPVQKKSGLD